MLPYGRLPVAIVNQSASGGWTWALSSVLGNYNDNVLGSRGRAAWALITLSTEGMTPIASITALTLTVGEGTPITFEGSAHAGGAATYIWSLGNGEVREGQRIDYAYPDSGLLDLSLTVITAAGASAATTQVTIANLPPVVTAGAPITVEEGTAVALAGSLTDPGSADTHTASWSFGDTQSATTLAASHAYANQGVYTATLTVTDDDGASASDSMTVTVVNAAPTITSTPATALTEGVPYSYALTATDPGANDVLTCTAPVKPAGATLTGCTLAWSPTFAQLAAPAPVTLCVADGDGGETCQSFEIAVSFIDAGAGYTAWQVSVALEEDVHYFWRARAGAGAVSGSWTTPECELIVDVTPPAAAPAPPAASSSGCGCSTSPAAPGGSLAVVLLLALWGARPGGRVSPGMGQRRRGGHSR